MARLTVAWTGTSLGTVAVAILLHDQRSPSLAGILLAVDGAPGSDGYLTAGVIGGTSIQAQLVTLSACDTGRGQLVPREGVLGLARAFLEAGAAAVLATLWPVEDAATLELMRAFYPRLARGEERSAALTAAMRELRDAALARRCGRTRFSGPHSS